MLPIPDFALSGATLADGILDRLVHNAHRIEMRGDSMRNNVGSRADSRLRDQIGPN